jgi:hypothetical protein
MYLLLKYGFIVFTCLCFFTANAQEDEDTQQSNQPKFKVVKWSKLTECQGKGTKFETGYVTSPQTGWVSVVIFFQRHDGTWLKKQYQREGSGYIQLNVIDCEFTGNHYAYVCYEKDVNCHFPNEEEVNKQHQESSQLPRFKITKKTKKADCNGIVFEEGYVYSPSGKTVEVSIYMEKKDGTWRKKHYTYYGTGNLELNITDCELTGNYKVSVQYIE